MNGYNSVRNMTMVMTQVFMFAPVVLTLLYVVETLLGSMMAEKRMQTVHISVTWLQTISFYWIVCNMRDVLVVSTGFVRVYAPRFLLELSSVAVF